MHGLVLTMWLLGLGVIGGSKPGAIWLARAECDLRAVPRLLGAHPSPCARECPCGDVCDNDVKDDDAKDDDADDHDVCDGCDPDEQEQKEGE